MKFSEIIQQLNLTANCHNLATIEDANAVADRNPDIIGVAAVADASPGHLSFIEGKKFAHHLEQTAASALILPQDTTVQARAEARQIAWITTANPRLLFARVINLFYQPFQPEPDIHPTAIVHPSAQIGEAVYIGPHVAIQAGVKIGNGVCIHPNVVIYPQVEVGDRTVLHANCTLHERSRIGADCVIHSGAAIGSEGFGFVPSATGWVKMNQSGCTVLEDGVEVGCNSAVDRPSVGETRIGRNTKVDNLVQIAHGCQVGQNCAIASQVGLSGRVKVGDGTILAGQVGVADGVEIGAGAIATAQSGLHRDVPPGTIVSGYPAIPNKQWLKTAALYNRLPEMNQSLRRLQRQSNPD